VSKEVIVEGVDYFGNPMSETITIMDDNERELSRKLGIARDALIWADKFMQAQGLGMSAIKVALEKIAGRPPSGVTVCKQCRLITELCSHKRCKACGCKSPYCLIIRRDDE